MSYAQLYPYLVHRGLVTIRYLPPPLNPSPTGFRPNAHCEFHEGAAGHDLEICFALKARVQDLIR